MDILALKYFLDGDEEWLEYYEENPMAYVAQKLALAWNGIPILVSSHNQYATYAIYNNNKWYFATFDVHFRYWRDLEETSEKTLIDMLSKKWP